MSASNSEEVANGQRVVQKPAAGAGESAVGETEREISATEFRTAQDAGWFGQESRNSTACIKF